MGPEEGDPVFVYLSAVVVMPFSLDFIQFLLNKTMGGYEPSFCVFTPPGHQHMVAVRFNLDLKLQ
jgi:hypothetical protein